MKQATNDPEALITMFSEATARQGEALRKSVGEATLKALQQREITIENVKKALGSRGGASKGTSILRRTKATVCRKRTFRRR